MLKWMIPVAMTACLAGGDDYSFKRDKQLHFAAGAIVGSVITYQCQKHDIKHPKLWGFLAATVIGLAKELHDRRQPGNRFDNADLAWAAAGGFAGATVTYSIRF